MKMLRIFICLFPLLNMNNIYYADSKYFSTFGETWQDYSEKGLKILDFVTLKKDLNSRFSSKERFFKSKIFLKICHR